MTRKTLSEDALPEPLQNSARRIGANIRLARRRRAITQDDMAARMFVTRKTLSRLEKGEVSVSIGVLMSALWVLGLERDIALLADPAKDLIGLQRERELVPDRVRKRQDEMVDF